MNEVVSFGTTDRSAEPGHSCPLASAKRIAELLTSSERSEAAIYHQVNRNPPNFSAEREGDFWLTTADNTRGDSKLATTENEAIRVASALEFFPRQFAFRFDKRVRGLTHHLDFISSETILRVFDFSWFRDPSSYSVRRHY